ncbi:MAG: phosphoenolpyruvate carboxylase [Micropruina sp.]
MTDDTRLRRDIRRLGDLLGETLARQESPQLVDEIELIRKLSREALAGDAAAQRRLTKRLSTADLPTAVNLIRAFGPLPPGQHRRTGRPDPHLRRTRHRQRLAGEGGVEGGRRARRTRPDHRAGPAAGPPGVHRAPDRGQPARHLIQLRQIGDALLAAPAG